MSGRCQPVSPGNVQIRSVVQLGVAGNHYVKKSYVLADLAATVGVS